MVMDLLMLMNFSRIYIIWDLLIITRERAVTMLAKVDSDGDGKINLEGKCIYN